MYVHLRLSRGSYYLTGYWSLWRWPRVLNQPHFCECFELRLTSDLVLRLCWPRREQSWITLGHNRTICRSDKQEKIIQFLSPRCDFLASRALLCSIPYVYIVSSYWQSDLVTFRVLGYCLVENWYKWIRFSYILCAVLSCVKLFATPWTVARQAPLSMGILQARILEWFAISSSRGSFQPGDRTALHVDSLPFEPPGKPMNTGVGSLSFLRGNLPYPGIKLGSPAFQVDSLTAELSGKPHLFYINSQMHYFGNVLKE